MNLPDQMAVDGGRRWRRRAVWSATAILSHSGYLARRLRRLGGLRILTYHGVCSDEVASEKWVPPHFVSAGAFAEQLRALARLGRIVPLERAIEGLCAGVTPPDPCFAITFDDGHACTLRHAIPAMEAVGVTGTIFVATNHADTGAWMLSDRLRLLGALPRSATRRMSPRLCECVGSPARFKCLPYDALIRMVDEYWPTIANQLDTRAEETLRPASWSELRQARAAGYEIGGHTASHVILARESAERRRAEIRDSVRRVREEVGNCVGFAYPNGGPDDYGDIDVTALREVGIEYAVTTTPGHCAPPLDMYRLPRTSIGLGHDPSVFTLEMCGCFDRRRLRQHVGEWAE